MGLERVVGIFLLRISSSYSSLSSKMRDQRSENAGYQGGIFWTKNEVLTSISPSRTTTKKEIEPTSSAPASGPRAPPFRAVVLLAFRAVSHWYSAPHILFDGHRRSAFFRVIEKVTRDSPAQKRDSHHKMN